jgi:hypothetical protein
VLSLFSTPVKCIEIQITTIMQLECLTIMTSLTATADSTQEKVCGKDGIAQALS